MWILFVLLINGNGGSSMKQGIEDKAMCEQQAVRFNEVIEPHQRYYAFCYPAWEESKK